MLLFYNDFLTVSENGLFHHPYLFIYDTGGSRDTHLVKIRAQCGNAAREYPFEGALIIADDTYVPAQFQLRLAAAVRYN